MHIKIITGLLLLLSFSYTYAESGISPACISTNDKQITENEVEELIKYFNKKYKDVTVEFNNSFISEDDICHLIAWSGSHEILPGSGDSYFSISVNTKIDDKKYRYLFYFTMELEPEEWKDVTDVYSLFNNRKLTQYYISRIQGQNNLEKLVKNGRSDIF